jgi:Subtilase family
MRIVIIDTGVETKHKALRNCSSFEGLTIIQKSTTDFEIIKESFEDEIGHGTGVLSIICEHINRFDPYIIKLQGINEYSEDLLCEGIYHALKVDKVKIINISLGILTDAPSERLKKLCADAHEMGVLIVASAHSNTHKPCYPAYFENVFGVGKGYFLSEKLYQYIPNNKTNILAKGTQQKIATLNNSYGFSDGTSYATAHFTGILYNILQHFRGNNIQDVISEIKNKSTQPIIEVPLNYTKTEEVLSYEINSSQQFNFYSSINGNVQNIALFPISCIDLRDIVLNKSLFNKKIVLGIDFLGCEDTIANSGIPIIKHIPNEEEMNLFDTIVISNITDGYGIDDFKFEILRQFVKYNKNIITWNTPMYSIIQQIINKENNQYQGKIYYPHYSETFMRESYLNLSLPPGESIPSLPIIEMEKNNEGFVHQYILSNILEKRGYNVSNIVTDPHGILFGNTDIVFPFTTRRMVDLEWEKWGVFLRLAKRLIAYRKHPDIFISGVNNILLDFKHTTNTDGSDLLKKTIFLKGVKPDAYIGVISSEENVDQIEKIQTYLDSVFAIEPLFFLTTQPKSLNRRYLKLSNKKKYSIISIQETNRIVRMIEKKFSN